MRNHPRNDESVTILYDKFSPEALQGIIEEFVTRYGTDTGYEKKTFENDVAIVKNH
jgi:uncharacterized protein YheU (UPF0270 family)